MNLHTEPINIFGSETLMEVLNNQGTLRLLLQNNEYIYKRLEACINQAISSNHTTGQCPIIFDSW